MLYKYISLIVFNLVVLFIIVNLLGYVGLKAMDLVKIYGGSAVSTNPWVDRQTVH